MNDIPRGQITAEQYDYLMRPLSGARVAKRSQGGKQLSYLESWDVKACLTRVFGFGNYDAYVIDEEHVLTREYTGSGDNPKPMLEVAWKVRLGLTVRTARGREIAHYVETAVGSASGQVANVGDLHDNAIKQGASDALKRCAINLGTQFGLSLYDDGRTTDVIRNTLVKPKGVVEKEAVPEEAVANLEKSLGAKVIGQDSEPVTEEPTTNEGAVAEPDQPQGEPDPAVGVTPEENLPTERPEPLVSTAENTKRRRQMFALFKDAGFPSAPEEQARAERLGYCQSIVNREVTSSDDLTYPEVVQVIRGLQDVIAAEKEGVQA